MKYTEDIMNKIKITKLIELISNDELFSECECQVKILKILSEILENEFNENTN